MVAHHYVSAEQAEEAFDALVEMMDEVEAVEKEEATEDENVQAPLEKYQELFKKGALLITDYSSVAFDFAYLKKPVLYYQSTNDYHFNLDESYFDYETMGFGEVCRSEAK